MPSRVNLETKVRTHMWYFIPVQHFQADRDALRKAGVTFSDRAVKVGHAMRAGILVDENYFERALEILGLAEIDQAYRNQVANDTITIVEIHPKPNYANELVFEGNEQAFSEQVKEILLETQQKLQRQLIARHCYDRQSSACNRTNAVQLQLLSWPFSVHRSDREQRQAYDQAVIPLQGNLQGYQLLFADNCPDPIALLYDDQDTVTVWLTFDPLGRHEKTRALFQFALHWATSVITEPTNPTPTWQDFQDFQRRTAFLEHCEARLAIEVREIGGTIEHANAELNAAREVFMTAYRKLDIFQRRQVALANGDESVIRYFMEQYAKEYDAIAESPYVTDFELTSNELKFSTISLEIAHDDHVYTVGKFDITVNLTNGSVRIIGTHPHIQSQKPCLGNIEADVAKLIAGRKYGVLVVLLIRYLQSVDVSDPWGARLFKMNLPKRKVGE